MAWKIKFSETAAKQFKKLDKHVAKQIKTYLEDKILNNDNPKAFGKCLVGNHSGIWRYRISTYRILCEIDDDELIVLVLRTDHRKSVYKKKT